MREFVINGIVWHVVFVRSSDYRLIRSDGSRTVGMTEWNNKCIYLDCNLRGAFLEKVLCHELCHCMCFSYDIALDIEQEEMLADWVSRYGRRVINLLDDLLSQKKTIPNNNAISW